MHNFHCYAIFTEDARFKNWTESFVNIRCKFIQLQFTSNINHIKAITRNMRRSFVTIYPNVNFFCQQKIQNDNILQLVFLLFCYVWLFMCLYYHSFSVVCKLGKRRNCSKWPDTAPLRIIILVWVLIFCAGCTFRQAN